MQALTALLAGLVFGIGLIVSGMVNPAKVLGFLDLAGKWDPSLALVMAGAIAVGAVAFALADKRNQTLLGTPMLLPSDRRIDRRLVLGSLLFGVGWGLAGFCPGPALVALGAGYAKAVVFVVAMLAGCFGVLALLLAGLGLYGVTAYAVSRQRRELGIRMALGAAPAGIVRLVLREGLSLLITGLCLGMAAAVAFSRLLRGFLYDVPALDPLTFALVPALLFIATLAACITPSVRAATTDPMVALRHE